MATPASWSPSFPPPHWTEKKRPETLESDRLPRRHNPSQLAMPYSSPPFTDRNLSSVVIQTQGRYRPQSESGPSTYALARYPNFMAEENFRDLPNCQRHTTKDREGEDGLLTRSVK